MVFVGGGGRVGHRFCKGCCKKLARGKISEVCGALLNSNSDSKNHSSTQQRPLKQSDKRTQLHQLPCNTLFLTSLQSQIQTKWVTLEGNLSEFPRFHLTPRLTIAVSVREPDMPFRAASSSEVPLPPPSTSDNTSMTLWFWKESRTMKANEPQSRRYRGCSM